MAAPDQTILWLTDAASLSEATLQGYAGWLGEDERQRAERFVRPARRRQFIVGRALLRLALGRLLGEAPKSIILQERPGNAPLLVSPGDGRMGFSISHSGPWVACAASAEGRVGMDIELIDAARDVDALAAQAFDKRERAWLAARPRASYVRDFYQMWSTAEARFKLGLAPASTFEFIHPTLSVVLCCEQTPLSPPTLALVTLDHH
jgi:4'-phosphopantetheinyl transferase